MSELEKHAQAMQSSKQLTPDVTASGTGMDTVQLPSTNTSIVDLLLTQARDLMFMLKHVS